MTLLIVLLALLGIAVDDAQSATYWVTQSGAGSQNGSDVENAYSLATFEGAGSGHNLYDLNGDTVCFSGTLTSSSGTLNIPDDIGAEGQYVTIDGDCGSTGTKAIVQINSGSTGFEEQDSAYIKYKNLDMRSAEGGDGRGIVIQCPGACTEVYVEDNHIQIDGAPGGMLCYGLWITGEITDSYIARNRIEAGYAFTPRDAFGGILIEARAYDSGPISNIHIYDNTVTGWYHHQLQIALIYASAPNSTVDGIYIHGNNFHSSTRPYGRALDIQANGYPIGALKNVYIFDNIIGPHRAPNQVAGQHIQIYRNIIKGHHNECMCIDGEPSGDGCVECYTCTDGNGDTWGDADHYYYMMGQAFTYLNGLKQHIYNFNNTYYDIAESVFQVRDSSGTVTGIHFDNNIVLNGASAPIGNWTQRDAYCYNWDGSEGDDIPPGSDSTWADYPIGIYDISVLASSTIKNNVFYGGKHFPDIVGDAAGVDEQWTVSEMHASFDDADNLLASGNEYSDPLLTNPTASNFVLKSSSPAVDQGFLTTITSEDGSGTSLTVGDAHYLGVPNISTVTPGETLRTSAGQTTTLMTVDYSDNTITVSPAISWSQGDSIALNYSGTAPDAGASEYAASTSGFYINTNGMSYGVSTSWNMGSYILNSFSASESIGYGTTTVDFTRISSFDCDSLVIDWDFVENPGTTTTTDSTCSNIIYSHEFAPRIAPYIVKATASREGQSDSVVVLDAIKVFNSSVAYYYGTGVGCPDADFTSALGVDYSIDIGKPLYYCGSGNIDFRNQSDGNIDLRGSGYGILYANQDQVFVNPQWSPSGPVTLNGGQWSGLQIDCSGWGN